MVFLPQMTIEWSLDHIKYHTKKLWGFEVVGGFQPHRAKENVYLAPTLGRETKCYLTVGQGPCPKSQRLIWVRRRGWPNPSEAERYGFHGQGPMWGHSCQVWFGLLQCCSSNMMINLRLDFHGLKSTSNLWLPIKGRVLIASVGGLVPHL